MPPRRQPVKAAAPDPWGPRYTKEDTVQTSDDDPDVFQDFSDTVTHALEDTMRNLRVLSEENLSERHGGRQPPPATAEYRGFELQALQNLTDEVKEIRATVAKLVTTSKLKASKGEFDKHKDELAKQVNGRLDTIRNWAGVAITAIGMGLTIISMVKRG